MNTFERHNIKHLSASSLNLWSAMPGLWVMRYLHGFKESTGAAMARGSAVESALLHILHRQGNPLRAAYASFQLSMQGEISDDIDKECALLPGMVAQCEQWQPPGALLATQIKVECFLDDVAVPIIGYVDFSFDTCDVDLKTTKACPSKPKAEHVRQVAIYRHARKKPGQLLYVTDKKHAPFDVTDEMRDAAIAELQSTAKSMERFLGRFDDPIDALECLPIDRDNFRWSDFAEKKYRFILERNSAHGFESVEIS